MLSLFSVSKTVQIAVNVPVSKIEILNDQIVYLNMDEDAQFFVDYVIYPTNAKNKNITFKTEAVGTSPLADIEYTDGYLIAKSCGKAKVILSTVDGGYRDSFVVEVTANRLQNIFCNIEKNVIYIGKTTRINTTFLPEDTNNTLLNYAVENPNIASVDADGMVTGLSKGTTTITIKSASNLAIFDTVEIEVKNKDIIDLISDEIVTWQSTGSIDISLDVGEQCSYSYTAKDENGHIVSNDVVVFEWDFKTRSQSIISLNYRFVDTDFVGSVFVTIKASTISGYEIEKTCTISRINQISANFVSSRSVGVKVNYQTIISFNVTPKDSFVTYDISLSNDNIEANINTQNKFIEITAKKLGKTTLTLKIINRENQEEFVTISKQIIILPTTIHINQTGITYGIQNEFALARTEVDGSLTSFAITTSFGNAVIGEDFSQYVSFWTSSENVSITSNGILTLNKQEGNEKVQIQVVFETDGFRVESEIFEINCIFDGVNVRNYLDLYNATNAQNSKPIVLQNNIKEDFAKGVGNNYYKEIKTTYDSTYYKNIGSEDKAKIKVLIEFKNDVYGNGYSINAHNVAWEQNLQNAGNNAIFAGPLNFVAMSESGGMVSVKAQDNVCFAVYENVTISNIELKGCDLTADENDQIDLTDLTYTGTTVEVFGDNVTIQYSRLSNGRTVLRAFGDILDSEKEINLNISNCVLSGAREFLARFGSNCFVDGTSANSSPSLPNDNYNTYPLQKIYDTLSDSQKAEYDNNFIKTYVTVKNSVFENAGIFAIGLDTHFSGPALYDGSAYLGGLVADWKNLAKTSYGVKLTFEEDVRMYNWKNLSEIDSSTLIEVLGTSAFSEEIKLDIPELIEALYKNPQFSNVTYTSEDQTQFLHSGIAFFGGGKNYCVFEDKNYQTYDLNGYAINLSDVGKGILQAASGEHDFYFLLCDATTLNFLPSDQERILASGEAYDCIYKKI